MANQGETKPTQGQQKPTQGQQKPTQGQPWRTKANLVNRVRQTYFIPLSFILARPMYAHLHTHSWYSFLEGLPSPQELAQAAAQAGLPALALTDTHSLTGAVEFQLACDSAGVQGILGLELLVELPLDSHVNLHEVNAGQTIPTPTALQETQFAAQSVVKTQTERLVLLAQDAQGWANLCALASMSAPSPSPNTPGVPFLDLEGHTAGLVCLAGNQRSWMAHSVRQGDAGTARSIAGRLADLFDRALYLSPQVHQPADQRTLNELAKIARQLNLPLAASHSTYYLHAEQAELQRLLCAIRLIKPLRSLSPGETAPPNAGFPAPAEMAQRFQGYPQALHTTLQIAERCRYHLPLGQPHFPNPPLEPGETADEALRKKAFSGAQMRYGEITPAIHQRLEHELHVIAECGYAALFLIVQEIIAFVRRANIPYSSRGSAGSSLVAYCLGITNPDPLRLNLYFERFLNPARATPPDIDTDLCSVRRDEVLRFVFERFGDDQVAMVSTINCFRERSALRETAKALGLPGQKISELVERLPYRWWGSQGEGQVHPYEELRQAFPDPATLQTLDYAAQVLGRPRHLSIHPGGVVIAPGPIHELTATQLAPKGLRITQLDLHSIEYLGMVKIDLLGIRGLSVLGEVERNLREQARQGVHVLQPETSPPSAAQPEDEAVSQMLLQGRTIGCFQIESPGMRATLREIHARSQDDLMVALALYRPGPLSGGLKRAFVERFRAQQKGQNPQVEHLHPSLEPLLADTYGVILYQEQVLRIAHELAGLSLADADLLRRAMSHFDPGKQMQTLKEKFIDGVYLRNQVPAETAERIWELMAAFAGYGFPKAHAASYAQIAWRAAWCKTHHPALFMAAVLANWGGYYSQRVYLNEARRLGLNLREPHINHARREFSVQYLEGKPVLFMGLDQVKDLTTRSQERILQQRPFHSLADFLVRVDPRAVEAENLIQIGALDGLGSIPQLLEAYRSQSWKSLQFPLFETDSSEMEGDWPLAKIVAAQEEILGGAVIAHPLELAASQIQAAQAVSTLEAINRPGQSVRVAGMRQSWRRGKSARGEVFYALSLEDLEGMLDVFIPGEVYRRCRSAFSKPGPWIIEGVMDANVENSEPRLRAVRVELLI